MDEKDKQIAELKKQLEAAQQATSQKEQELSQAGEVVTELKKKLTEQPAATGTATYGQFSAGKQTYELLEKAFNYQGRIITIDVLKEESKLAEELVKDRVSFLRKVA